RPKACSGYPQSRATTCPRLNIIEIGGWIIRMSIETAKERLAKLLHVLRRLVPYNLPAYVA
ncbi:MAG TPA: hypothetical protein VFQ02_02840, partial [Nitrospira sp.]|nr:hypothetical protein [Nitrospira sp.]